MTYLVLLHPDVVKYLDILAEKERARCYSTLKLLEDDPFKSRPKCDIKKLRGERKTAYRLRVGSHRFTYIVSAKDVLVEEAFKREKGY